MRLIDADALKAIRFHDLPYSQIVPTDCDTDDKVSAYKLGWNDAIDAIVESAPTVDAEPVRHGHWEYKHLWKGVEAKYCECSACHHPAWWPTDYCPNCGAKMDEVREDEQ